ALSPEIRQLEMQRQRPEFGIALNSGLLIFYGWGGGNIILGRCGVHGSYFSMTRRKRVDSKKRRNQTSKFGQSCSLNQSISVCAYCRTKGAIAKSANDNCAPNK